MNTSSCSPARRSRLPALAALAVLAIGDPGPTQAQTLPAGTLTVANMDDDSVWLIDLPTGRRTAVVPTTIAPHEVTTTPDGRTALVANYGDERGPGNLVQVLDVARGVELSRFEIPGVERVHAAHFLDGDSLVIATSERTQELLVVSAVDGSIRRRLPTEGRGSHMTVRGGSHWFTANIPDGTVSRVDPRGAEPTEIWQAGSGTEGIGAAADGSTVWTGSMGSGEVVGLDGRTGAVRARVRGFSIPYRLAVSSRGEVLVSDPQAHEFVVVDADAGTILARIDVGEAAAAEGRSAEPSPQGFTVSSDGRWAFVSLKAVNAVAVIDLDRRAVEAFVETGAGPDGIAFSPGVRSQG